MAGPQPPRLRADARARRAAVTMRWGLAIGWLLALPGLAVIACFAALWPLASWAGCTVTGVEVRCPATPPGRIAEAAGAVVAATAVLAYVGIGLLPPLYSAVWVMLRLARRIGWWWLLGLVMLAGILARVAAG